MLFIGGVADGKRMDVHGRDTFAVPEIAPTPVCDITEPVAASVEYRTILYKAMPFRGEKETMFIMARNGLSADDVLRRLINGYAGKVK